MNHKNINILSIVPNNNSIWQHMEGLNRLFNHKIIPSNESINLLELAVDGIFDNLDLIIWAGDFDKIINTVSSIKNAYPKIKHGWIFCSSIGEFEIQNEWDYIFKRIHSIDSRYNEWDKMFNAFFTGDRFIEKLKFNGHIDLNGDYQQRIFHLPQTMNKSFYSIRDIDDRIENSIGLLSTSRPKKNIANQLAACNILKNEYKYRNLKVFTDSLSPELRTWGSMLGLNIIEKSDRMPRGEWIDLLGQMHIVCQVTYADSFNYIIAESVLMGVPVVCGSNIDWMSDYSKVEDNTNPYQIADKIKSLLKNDDDNDILNDESYNNLIDRLEDHDKIICQNIRKVINA